MKLPSNTASTNVSPTNKALHRSVFISHAKLNFNLADEVRKLLEERGISCWIAPKDIPAGSSYGEKITRAIDGCSVTVLILTEQSNASKPVANEIEMSFARQKTIIPLRLREVKPSKMLEFYVSNAQWIDAFYTPLKQRVQEIVNIVHAVENGVALPEAEPEKKTFAGSAERYLEQLLRHKMLAAVLAFALLLGLGATATISARKTQALSDADVATVAKDPSTIGLVKLSAAQDDGRSKEASLAINAAVYLNVKGATFKDAQLVAVVRTYAAETKTLNLSTLLALEKNADVQSGVFQIPVNAKQVTVCLSTKHPTLLTNHTAMWVYDIRATSDKFELVRDGTPTLSSGVPTQCHE